MVTFVKPLALKDVDSGNVLLLIMVGYMHLPKSIPVFKIFCQLECRLKVAGQLKHLLWQSGSQQIFCSVQDEPLILHEKHQAEPGERFYVRKTCVSIWKIITAVHREVERCSGD